MIQNSRLTLFCSIYFLFTAVSFSTAATANKIIIAESGGGAPLLGNSLESTVLAVASGIEHLELQVTMTGDQNLILFDSPTLNKTTDVKTLFPEKAREDGNFYVSDFTLAEIRQLRTTDPFENGPLALTAAIPSLQEELSLIKSLERYFEKTIGLVFDIKPPVVRENSHVETSEQLLDLLEQAGYQSDNTIYIQSSDSDELQRLHSTLMPQKKFHVDLIQKIEDDQDSQWVFTNAGLRIASTYASAISLPEHMIQDQAGAPLNSLTLEAAKKYGLMVFVQLGNNVKQNSGEVEKRDHPSFTYRDNLHIDGIFTSSYKNVSALRHPRSETKIKDDSLPPFFQSLDLTRSRQTATPAQVSPEVGDLGETGVENENNKTFDLQ